MRLRPPLVLLACAATLAACSAERAPTGASDSLAQSFDEASTRYGVPRELLLATTYVETRWHSPATPALDGGCGLAQLRDLPHDRSLPRAAALTGFSRETLCDDPRANLLGAAAVLREQADRVFASYDALREEVLADWYDVVTRRTGLSDLRLAEDYANRVFHALEHGATRTLPSGETLRLEATPIDLSGKRAFGQTLSFLGESDGYPGVRWISADPSNFGTRSGAPLEYIVIHTVQGSYNSAISWFRNPDANVSAHYVISAGGDITQMVRHADMAWHVRSANDVAIGIEHEGFIDDPAWATPQMYATSAALTRWICDTLGLPRTRDTVRGHVEIPGNTHTDPGPYWNWSHYMALVESGAPGEPRGELLGVVYADPDTNERIAGATVALDTGESRTTGENGSFRFSLLPGTYTLTASAEGYEPASLTREVSAGTEAWGSIGLPLEPTRIVAVTGLVHTLAPDDRCFTEQVACDASRTLAGAEVVLTDGKRRIRVETAEDGTFAADLPEGTWLALASHPEHLTRSHARVLDESTTSQPIVLGLLPKGAASADKNRPLVVLEAPHDGMTIEDIPEVLVQGYVVDGTISEEVLLAGEPIPLADGRFAAFLRLTPGVNEIHLESVDRAGNVGSLEASVTYEPPRSVLRGFVFLSPEPRKRVKGASVALVSEDQALHAEGTTGLDGFFALEAEPGTYVVAIEAAGHERYEETVTLAPGKTLETRFGLPPPRVDSIALLSPQHDSIVRTPFVTVQGTTSLLDASEVLVNGKPASLGKPNAHAGLPFQAQIELELGRNELVAQVKAGARVLEDRSEVFYVPPSNDGSREVFGGCASGGSALSLFSLVSAAFMLLRRRRA